MKDGSSNFLEGFEYRAILLHGSQRYESVGLILGKGNQPLEVVVAKSNCHPNALEIKQAWKIRLAGRITPLLFVVLYEDKAAFCGPSGEDPLVFKDIEKERVERICRKALNEPDHHSALRFLHNVIPEVDAPLAGIRNEGLVATHELQHGVPNRSDWLQATERSSSLFSCRDNQLLKALGFTIETLPGPVSILRSENTKIAIAVLLEQNEAPDTLSARFLNVSPVFYALAKADEENLPYVIALAGSLIRLYPVRPGIGIGRRGRTETFLQVDLDILENNKAGFLWLLFSASALSPGGSFDTILAKSKDFAADLGSRLRERIHGDVIPALAQAILTARKLEDPTIEDLSHTYQIALLILFRLLFIAYAEDKDLLPYRTNDFYRSRSMKQKARDLQKVLEAGTYFDKTPTHWIDCFNLFKAIEEGKGEWDIPQYNGGLFSSDPKISKTGADLAEISLPNDIFGFILAHLILDKTPEGNLGPVDFRSLSVREFGTIYEGLLENELSIADVDLVIGKDGEYRATKKKDNIAIRAGNAYLHNASGARKITGSFFTKSFVVEHLLEHALEPALNEHLKRIDSIKNGRKAAEAFFDFRVADIAMGSGHFLVAAIDRIERAFSRYLVGRQIPEVSDELSHLKSKALHALGSLADGVEIEDTQLLRRQIARRCIYGVDINPLAVQLARLSIWIHTFIPGLPLSFLDHNLVYGNSLVGIAAIEEARDFISDKISSLFEFSQSSLIGGAYNAISQMLKLSDADIKEISQARRASDLATTAVAPAAALFDIIAAVRIDSAFHQKIANMINAWINALDEIPGSKEHREALDILKEIPPFHFPVSFPEVFMREQPGFDVILGNPPWEEATVEEDRFWTRYFPGLHSLPQHEQEAFKKKKRKERPDLIAFYEHELQQAMIMRKALICGAFPGMGTGDPDLYKAFAWRFLHLAKQNGGRIGVVLPRSAFSAKGSTEFRKTLFLNGVIEDLTTLLNRSNWVFEDVEPRYTISLVSLEKKPVSENEQISLRGPYNNQYAYENGITQKPICFYVREVMSWSDTASLPLLPDEKSADAFLQLRKALRLDVSLKNSWISRPYSELHATNEKKLMILKEKCPEGCWPIFKGESFDIWTADTGSYYAWGEPQKLIPYLQKKRIHARSAFDGFPPTWILNPDTLPCFRSRIAFRDVTRSTDSRTVRASLIPPKVFITNKAPYLLWPQGDEKDQAYLLGILCSIALDWYARRFVEISLSYFIFNPLPIPRIERQNPLYQRIILLAGRLACPDDRFSEWAHAVGVSTGLLEEDEKNDMIHELDAVVAHLYGLSAEQLSHIFATFHEGWDYEDRLKATLKYYHIWKNKL